MMISKLLDINSILPTLETKVQADIEFAKVQPMIDQAIQNAENHTFVTKDKFKI